MIRARHGTRSLAVLTLVVVVATVGAPMPAAANVAHYEIRVDGLACPFCAYGLEKKLKKLPGVSDLQIDLDPGRASFDVADSTVLLPGPVQEAVRDAGFSPRGVTVRATGSVTGPDDALSLDVGHGHSLEVRGGEALDRLRALIGEGHRDVVITGPVTRSGEGWRVQIDSVTRQEGS